jgi:hypothetical protein
MFDDLDTTFSDDIKPIGGIPFPEYILASVEASLKDKPGKLKQFIILETGEDETAS